VRSRFVYFVSIVQASLFLGHWFVYETWTWFWRSPAGALDPPGNSVLTIAMALLSVSFLSASLLAYRYKHVLVRAFYAISAAWLGVVLYFLFAAVLCWPVYALVRLLGLPWQRWPIAALIFGLALVLGIYGLVNAARPRLKRINVRLPNLPQSWRARTAALVTDTHLGPVRNYGFMRRIAQKIARQNPDVVLISGDFYDGTAADYDRLAKPWATVSAPFGIHFVAGNHEEFSNSQRYFDALEKSGVNVLGHDKVILDGLQLVGVHYHEASHPDRLRSNLQRASIDRNQPSILLTHAPDHPQVAAEEGFSLQLSGHTHRGQFIPFSWIVDRIYKQFAYGLNRCGELLVYTSCGAGTWGPPMRVGTTPEIVFIHFE
jgi:uncharacterized protein